MNALFGLFALPTAATAMDAVGKTVKAAATPFEAILSAATSARGPGEAAEVGGESDDESLEDRVARGLQELLQSVGIAQGEPVRLAIDDSTGQISVADGHPLAAAIEQQLHADPQLSADILQLSTDEGKFRPPAFLANRELEVELDDSQEIARLSWL